MSNNDHKDPLSYWQARALEAERERDELAAMVGRLREVCRDQAKTIMSEFQTRSSQTIDDFLPEVLRESPPEALRHIKAEAAGEGFVSGALWQVNKPVGKSVTAKAAEYAQRIKNGEVE